MIIKKHYEYPKLERVTHKDGSRYYVEPDGTHLRSVTTILDATKDKSGLEQWKKRVGNKKAEQTKIEAVNLGTLMHLNLECHIMGTQRPQGDNLLRVMSRNMADQIINCGLRNISEVWGMEEILYVPGLYAGTTDLIAVHKGSPAIIDYKSTNKPKTKDQIVDYWCQGAAYAIAHNELFDTDIEKVVIFMVSRDLHFDEFVIEGNEFHKYRAIWLERLEQYLATT